MWYRIRATRSTIGMPKSIRETYESLGLNRRGSIVYQKVSPGAAGQILKIKELVNVQLVDKVLTPEEERALRRTRPGYSVVKQ